MDIKDYLNLSFEISKSLQVKKEVLKRIEDSIAATNDNYLLKSLKREKEKVQTSINNDIYTRIDILRLIERVDNMTLRMVLEYKYICGLSVMDIAEKLHYSIRHVVRMHAKALEEAEKLYKIA